MLQIGVGTLTDGLRNLLHRGVAFGVGHDFLALDDGKQQRQDSADEADP